LGLGRLLRLGVHILKSTESDEIEGRGKRRRIRRRYWGDEGGQL
jgi:hypothetical protein